MKPYCNRCGLPNDGYCGCLNIRHRRICSKCWPNDCGCYF